jgi:hypothetical protein
MPAQYFPLNDQEFESWLTTFLANLGAVMTALGLAATFDDALVAAKATFSTELGDHVTAQAAALAQAQVKDDSKAATITELRNVVNQLRGNPAFTDAMATSLGLPVYDTVPSPTQPWTEVPSLEIDTSAPQHHRVKFWMMTDEGTFARAKPAWARACRIVHKIVATGQPAPAIETMDFLASDTSTPYDWDIPGSEVGKDIWYRGAWETPRGEIGPWSDPAKGTVTG